MPELELLHRRHALEVKFLNQWLMLYTYEIQEGL